jgi:hypothetical protein
MRIGKISILVLALAIGASAQRGAIVRPTDLADLTGRSERIVHAHVVSAKVEPHPRYPNLSTVVVTLGITETLKGTAAKQVTFRQFIWDARDESDAAGYRKGRELLLFLRKPNQDGLTSPVGMDQGRMDIVHEADGRVVVRPKFPNRVLLRGVSESLRKKGRALPMGLRKASSDDRAAIELSDMKSAVRELSAEAKTK